MLLLDNPELISEATQNSYLAAQKTLRAVLERFEASGDVEGANLVREAQEAVFKAFGVVLEQSTLVVATAIPWRVKMSPKQAQNLDLLSPYEKERRAKAKRLANLARLARQSSPWATD